MVGHSPQLTSTLVEQTARTRLNLHMRPLPLLLLTLVLLAVFLLVLVLGSVTIPLDEILRVLSGGEASRASWTTIVWQIRLPKAITALLAGSALAVSGLLMQTFFRNPLAGPFTLGVSSGASLGAAIVVLAAGSFGGTLFAGFGLAGDLALAFAAGIGAALSMGIVLLVSIRIRSAMTLLVLGMMFSYFTGAMVSLLLYFSVPERIQSYIQWTFGTFATTTWNQLIIFIPLLLIGLLISFGLAKSLNALLLGETYARSLGVNLQTARIGIITATALLAGTVTAFCGPIGFVGMAVPHVARALLNSSDHRMLLPATALIGAITALIATLIAELPGSQIVLPLNAVTALIGAPIVIWVIMSRSKGF